MLSTRKGSGLENCIPLYFPHFYKATDPERHNCSPLSEVVICSENGLTKRHSGMGISLPGRRSVQQGLQITAVGGFSQLPDARPQCFGGDPPLV